MGFLAPSISVPTIPPVPPAAAPPTLANTALGAKIADAHRVYLERIGKAAGSLKEKSHAKPAKEGSLL